MKNLFTLLLLTLSFISYPQAPGIIWQKTLGGSATDAISLEPYTYPVEIIRTPDSLGFVVITSTTSRDGDVTGSHGRMDIWVIKMNFNGDTIWKKALGGTEYDYSQKSFVHSDGSITIFGFSESINGDVVGWHGNRDIWVVKLSSSGTLLWQRPLGGSAEDGLRSVEVLPDNSYIIAGYTFSNNGDVSGNHGSSDVWIVKLSSSGALQWQKCYGGSNEDRPRVVQSIPGNQYLVVGGTFSNNGDVSGNHGNSDAWIFKIDNSGTILTKKLYGGSHGDVAYKVVIANNGNYIVMGGTDSNDGDVSGFHGVAGVSSRDTWVFCIDPLTLALNWQKCIGGSLEELPSHMIENTNGDVIIFSSTFSSDGDANNFHGFVDLLCTSLTPNGVTNWSKCVGGPGIEHGGVTYLSPIDNSMVFIGVTDSPDGPDVQGHHGGGDAWIVKLNSSGNVVWQRTLGGSSVEHAFFIDAINDNEYLIACYTLSDDGDLHYNNRPGNLWIMKMGPVNRIKGTEFADFNRNGIKDAGEPFSDWPVQAEKPGYTRITVPFNNSFLLEVESGNINTKIVSQNSYYDITPLNHVSVFPGFGGSDSVTFVLTPRPGIRDLTVNLAALNPARPGRPLSYKLIYKNVGTDTVASGTVLFKRDSRLEFISSSLPNNSISGDTLKWNYTNLLPFDTVSREITINLWVPSPPIVNINDTLSSTAIITPVAGDLTPGDDTVILKQIAIAAFDPNDKTENLGGKITLQQMSSGTYINYLIRFQNVGIDTAFNITIRDTLSSKLNWSSFQTVAASHKYKLKITDQNKIRLNFENIRLVDSIHNEPASHGYLLYRIKPKTDLVLGDTIKNSASVYFDVNLPVKTNTQNTIVSNNIITGINNPAIDHSGMLLFPNPSGNKIWIKVKDRLSGKIEIIVYDSYGNKVIHESPGQVFTDNYTKEIDLRRLPAGTYIISLRTKEKIYSEILIITNRF